MVPEDKETLRIYERIDTRKKRELHKLLRQAGKQGLAVRVRLHTGTELKGIIADSRQGERYTGIRLDGTHIRFHYTHVRDAWKVAPTRAHLPEDIVEAVRIMEMWASVRSNTQRTGTGYIPYTVARVQP